MMVLLKSLATEQAKESNEGYKLTTQLENINAYKYISIQFSFWWGLTINFDKGWVWLSKGLQEPLHSGMISD